MRDRGRLNCFSYGSVVRAMDVRASEWLCCLDRICGWIFRMVQRFGRAYLFIEAVEKEELIYAPPPLISIADPTIESNSGSAR